MSSFEDMVLDFTRIPQDSASAFMVDLFRSTTPPPPPEKTASVHAGLLKLAVLKHKCAQGDEAAVANAQRKAMVDPQVQKALDYEQVVAEREEFAQALQDAEARSAEAEQVSQQSQQQAQESQMQADQANQSAMAEATQKQDAMQQAIQARDTSLQDQMAASQKREELVNMGEELKAQLDQLRASTEQMQQSAAENPQADRMAAEQEQAAVQEEEAQGAQGQGQGGKAGKETQEAQNAQQEAVQQAQQADEAQAQQAQQPPAAAPGVPTARQPTPGAGPQMPKAAGVVSALRRVGGIGMKREGTIATPAQLKTIRELTSKGDMGGVSRLTDDIVRDHEHKLLRRGIAYTGAAASGTGIAVGALQRQSTKRRSTRAHQGWAKRRESKKRQLLPENQMPKAAMLKAALFGLSQKERATSAGMKEYNRFAEHANSVIKGAGGGLKPADYDRLVIGAWNKKHGTNMPSFNEGGGDPGFFIQQAYQQRMSKKAALSTAAKALMAAGGVAAAGGAAIGVGQHRKSEGQRLALEETARKLGRISQSQQAPRGVRRDAAIGAYEIGTRLRKEHRRRMGKPASWAATGVKKPDVDVRISRRADVSFPKKKKASGGCECAPGKDPAQAPSIKEQTGKDSIRSALKKLVAKQDQYNSKVDDFLDYKAGTPSKASPFDKGVEKSALAIPAGLLTRGIGGAAGAGVGAATGAGASGGNPLATIGGALAGAAAGAGGAPAMLRGAKALKGHAVKARSAVSKVRADRHYARGEQAAAKAPAAAGSGSSGGGAISEEAFQAQAKKIMADKAAKASANRSAVADAAASGQAGRAVHSGGAQLSATPTTGERIRGALAGVVKKRPARPPAPTVVSAGPAPMGMSY